MAVRVGSRSVAALAAAGAAVGIGVLAANASTPDNSDQGGRPVTSETGGDLGAAMDRVTSRATSEHWPVTAVSWGTPATNGIVVELMTTDPLPELEKEIRAIAAVQVTFEYGASPGIQRPAKVDLTPGKLLVLRADQPVLLEAAISGQLGLNPSGCFTIKGYIVVASAGSEVTSDGLGIRLAGSSSSYRLGDEIRVGGGVMSKTLSQLPEGANKCTSEPTDELEVVLTSGSIDTAS